MVDMCIAGMLLLPPPRAPLVPWPVGPAGGSRQQMQAGAGAACVVDEVNLRKNLCGIFWPVNELIKLFGLLSEPPFQSVCAPCSKSSATVFIHFAFWLKVSQQGASAQGKFMQTMHKVGPRLFPQPNAPACKFGRLSSLHHLLEPIVLASFKAVARWLPASRFSPPGVGFFALFQVLWGF